MSASARATGALGIKMALSHMMDFTTVLLQVLPFFLNPSPGATVLTRHTRSQRQTCEHRPTEETLEVSHSDFIRANIWLGWC